MSSIRPRLTVTLAILALCLLTGLTLRETTVSAQLASDTPMALEIIALLNEWRIEANLAPLKPNDTLHALALDQASYLSTLADIPSGNAMHLGPGGEGVRERALFPQYNWPTYGGLPAMAEVAYVGRPETALEFWRNSAIHRDTITNVGVREIGVAAVPHVWGHIFIVVLASRPDVLPALVDPRSNSLYLTQDTWKFGVGNVPPMQVMLFDSAGRPLNNGAWIPWAQTIPLPADITGKVFVLYDDGSRLTLAEVDLIRDLVLLPGYIPVATPSPVATQLP